MTLRWADRVLDTSTTTGTGQITVSGTAPTGYITFGSIPSIANNDTFYYTITDQTTSANYEIGLGTWNTGNQFTRTTVLASSNSGSAVNFTSGAIYCWCDHPADRIRNTLFADTASQTISGGATVTALSQSTGNITIDCGARPLQYITNNGSWTITAPTADGFCVLLVTNGASAATPTFSGFTVGSNTGDALNNTNTNKFMIFVTRINGTATYTIKALQ